MLWMVGVFLIGYLLITLEHTVHVNKAATALIVGVLLWTVYMFNGPGTLQVEEQLMHHLGEISSILFFLLAAMTIVEIIDLHDGFDVIVKRIRTDSKSKLYWIISLLAFFLSAILDNLTTTIVLVSFLKKLVPERQERLMFAGLVVIAANAGGAFTPIGDVTTTMLWIAGQITTANIALNLILPSIACVVLPVFFVSFSSRGRLFTAGNTMEAEQHPADSSVFERRLVLILGVSALIFVPVFKVLTHLPPYMGILLALGVMWAVTELIHHRKDDRIKNKFSVLTALRKADAATVLFFLGILLSVAALQSAGYLSQLTDWLSTHIGNFYLINFLVGLASSLLDNVPLVAAMLRMYDGVYMTDHAFWEFLAYCAGTGGSVLIIGSASGVAVMGMERISFGWYLKHVSLLALMGYVAGALVYMMQQYMQPQLSALLAFLW